MYKKWSIKSGSLRIYASFLFERYYLDFSNVIQTLRSNRDPPRISPEESYQSSISSIPFIPFLVQKFKKKKKEKNKDPVPVQFSLSCQLIPKPLIPSRFRYKVYTYIYIYKAWRRRHIDTFARENFSDPDFPSVSNWKGRQVPAQVEK